MRRFICKKSLSKGLVALSLALACALAPTQSAFARGGARVEWTRVDAPKSKDGERIAKVLKGLLKEASKRADFGSSGTVAVEARVTEYVVETRGDVMRIRCTVVGKLKGGPSAKSRISFGGDPKDPKALEKQVLTMVAQGVTSRLAAIAKGRKPQPEKKH